MVEGRKKSRTFRRVKVKTPGGETKVHYKRRKPSKAKCSGCKALLKGVPRELPYKMQNMPKTKKRPERPYGGVLCSKCMRAKIIEKTRISK
jgi:large subunit ribosomal protein L34e